MNTAEDRIEALEAELAACKRDAEETATNLRAERDTARADLAACKRDAERLDWLATSFVEVRIPTKYGSRACFMGAPEDEEFPIAWNIRRKIDAAMAAQEKA